MWTVCPRFELDVYPRQYEVFDHYVKLPRNQNWRLEDECLELADLNLEVQW